MKGNMIKYPVRAGRKDDELEDFRDYADRLIEKWRQNNDLFRWWRSDTS